MTLSLNNKSPDPEKWVEIFNHFEKDYKKAYFSIDKAIKLDEEGKMAEALPVYEFGLSLIDKALALSLNEPLEPDLLWEKALVMTQKLKKTRKEILNRVGNIKSKPEVKSIELPSSYEEVITNSKPDTSGTIKSNGNTFQLSGPSKDKTLYEHLSATENEKLLANFHFDEQDHPDASVTYLDLSQQLKEMKLAKNKEILYFCDNAQLYFIAPDGIVSSTSETNALIIARMNVDILDVSEITFLQVGPWNYPLIPGVSRFIRSEYGSFIFSDINSEIEGAAFGIILPEDKHEEVNELLEHLLHEVTTTGRSRRSVPTDYSSGNFSSKIVHGATYLAHGLVRGAGSTAKYLDYWTPKIVDRINPNPEPKPIDPAIQKVVEVSKIISEKAVDVTNYLTAKICTATSVLGRYLAPYIQRQGTYFLTSITNLPEEEALQKMNFALDVASDTAKSISTIYNGLNDAGSILARSLANNMVQIIEYKYGQPAGGITNDAITTLENVFYAHRNFRVLKPKGIAKATIRGTGQALVENYRSSNSNSKPYEEFQGSGPGSGSGFS